MTIIDPEAIITSPDHSFVPEVVRFPNGQVYIKCPHNPDEWMYIELQGELQSTTKGSQIHKGSLAGSTGEHLFNLPLGLMTIEDSVSISALDLTNVIILAI